MGAKRIATKFFGSPLKKNEGIRTKKSKTVTDGETNRARLFVLLSHASHFTCDCIDISRCAQKNGHTRMCKSDCSDQPVQNAQVDISTRFCHCGICGLNIVFKSNNNR